MSGYWLFQPVLTYHFQPGLTSLVVTSLDKELGDKHQDIGIVPSNKGTAFVGCCTIAMIVQYREAGGLQGIPSWPGGLCIT